MRRPDFPDSLQGQRAVIAITAVLVLATLGTAVATSGGSETSSAAATTTTATPVVKAAGEAPSSPAGQPTATSGSPGTPAAPSAAAPTATTSLALSANRGGELSYNTKTLSAKAGKVTITMTNMSPLEHNVTVAQGSTVLGATPTFVGGSKTLTLNLKAGSYTFYCSVPGHRQAGMEGTLTVS